MPFLAHVLYTRRLSPDKHRGVGSIFEEPFDNQKAGQREECKAPPGLRTPRLLTMNQQLIGAIAIELRENLKGRRFGKIFQLGPLSFAIDFGFREEFLYISVEPSSPRLYLIKRKVKELEKQSSQLSYFGTALRAKLGHGELVAVEKLPSDRVVRLSFRVVDDIGDIQFRHLIVQLTGRASNLFIVNELDRIVFALRPPKGPGQQLGDLYTAPPSGEPSAEVSDSLSPRSSAEADDYFRSLDEKNIFEAKATRARSQLKGLLKQKEKLKSNLEADLVRHGDSEAHQKLGNLLLANLTTAIRNGNRVTITDFYAEGEPTIEIEIDENRSLQDEATRQFRDYTRAKRAAGEIEKRLAALKSELVQLEARRTQLENIIAQRDEKGLDDFTQAKSSTTTSVRAKKQAESIPGIRRYRSTDGLEIWVGRAARDNDQLTFRHAKPNDLWLHAGDYPGSHVVIRNPGRQEIPHRTVIEAAQLAARFSQASDDSKVVVHYTQRKFLSKPKGAAPGLVRMSSFRSITVAPLESVERI